VATKEKDFVSLISADFVMVGVTVDVADRLLVNVPEARSEAVVVSLDEECMEGGVDVERNVAVGAIINVMVLEEDPAEVWEIVNAAVHVFDDVPEGALTETVFVDAILPVAGVEGVGSQVFFVILEKDVVRPTDGVVDAEPRHENDRVSVFLVSVTVKDCVCTTVHDASESEGETVSVLETVIVPARVKD
jgi:hypothetical protein